jgi:hypothetical protein
MSSLNNKNKTVGGFSPLRRLKEKFKSSDTIVKDKLYDIFDNVREINNNFIDNIPLKESNLDIVLQSVLESPQQSNETGETGDTGLINSFKYSIVSLLLIAFPELAKYKIGKSNYQFAFVYLSKILQNEEFKDAVTTYLDNKISQRGNMPVGGSKKKKTFKLYKNNKTRKTRK